MADLRPSAHSKALILLAVCISAIVLPLSFTGGAVATPSIAREFRGGAESLMWITNAFMLTFGSLLMAAGSLADKLGRKQIFKIGMVLFAGTSIALCMAQAIGVFNGLRALQGVAAALALASGTAALAQEFEGHARTRAFSLLGTTFGIGLAFGPVVAGVLIELSGWRAIFAVTAALSVVSLLFGVPRMRETRDTDAAPLDAIGILTFSAALGVFTFALIKGPQTGWISAEVAGLVAAAVALGAWFVKVELRLARPMLDLRLFRISRFVGVQMLPIGTCYGYIVLVVLLPLRLIGIEGMTELDAGWIMMALSAPMLVVPSIAAMLTRWISPGALSGLGFLISAAGLQWLRMAGAPGHPETLVLPLILIGVGAGFPWGLMDGLAVSVVPNERAGMAAGVFNTARVAGEGLTLAIASAFLSGLIFDRLRTFLPDGANAGEMAQSLASGDLHHAAAAAAQWLAPMQAAYQDAFAVLLHALSIVTVLAALVSFLTLRGPAQGHPKPSAQEA